MRIVFLDTTLDSSTIGGAQIFLRDIMRELGNANDEVHFITKGRKKDKQVFSEIRKSGAIIHDKIWPESMLVEDAAPILADWLEKLDPDVFVVSVSADIGWVVLPLLSSRIATFAIGHNDAKTFYEPAKHYASFLNGVIGVSEEICDHYVRNGIPKEKVSWIPYGVKGATDFPHQNDNDPDMPIKLIYAGRLDEEQKRSSDLVGIITKLTDRNIKFEFRIIGDGASYHNMKSQLEDYIAGSVVKMPGWISNSELLQRYQESDVFVLTSAYEGFCISLVESMANGCCPVVTDIRSGNKQLVSDGVNGFVIPVGDTDAFAEKIGYLQKERIQLNLMRRRSWEKGMEYNMERMRKAYSASFASGIADAKNHFRKPDPAFPLMDSCKSTYPTWLRKIKSKFKTVINF